MRRRSRVGAEVVLGVREVLMSGYEFVSYVQCRSKFYLAIFV